MPTTLRAKCIVVELDASGLLLKLNGHTLFVLFVTNFHLPTFLFCSQPNWLQVHYGVDSDTNIAHGDSTSGKSSICQVFHSDNSFFPKNYTMTSGVELLVKQVNIPETKDSVELYLYDSAGKEVFTDFITKFWDHPSVLVVVYDCTSETSFNSCEKWVQRVRQMSSDTALPGVVIANKIDLDQRRLISPKMGMDFAASQGLKYFECSAKEMQAVDGPFYYLANEFYKLYQERLEMFKSLGMH